MSFVSPKYPNAILGNALVPPPESLLAYATAIADANRRPRSRSEWEARFAFWQKPASDTEEAEIEVALMTTTGQRIFNYPVQHYINGCAKNDRTGRRYKRVVRILKRIRNHMAENIYLSPAARDRAKNTSSFLIESLVYNCLDIGHFQNASIYDDVVAVLRYLSYVLGDRSSGATLLGAPTWAWWREVNGLKPLFALEQAWTVATAAEFIGLAKEYVGV